MVFGLLLAWCLGISPGGAQEGHIGVVIKLFSCKQDKSLNPCIISYAQFPEVTSMCRTRNTLGTASVILFPTPYTQIIIFYSHNFCDKDLGHIYSM